MTDKEKAILRLTMIKDLFDDLSVNSNCVSVLLNREDELALKTAIEALKEQRPHGEWILCSERLPNTNGIYIVTRIIEAHFIVDVSYFDGSNTWHADNRINHSRDYLKDVVAWMPLPEPYKEEGEAE